ncbi:hypothetical protein [Metabacillus sediminilitoris]|nr:hypothetical protein [Metabacillus sediminilitoris]
MKSIFANGIQNISVPPEIWKLQYDLANPGALIVGDNVINMDGK